MSTGMPDTAISCEGMHMFSSMFVCFASFQTHLFFFPPRKWHQCSCSLYADIRRYKYAEGRVVEVVFWFRFFSGRKSDSLFNKMFYAVRE